MYQTLRLPDCHPLSHFSHDVFIVAEPPRPT
jgi:hypothetical protein